MELPEVVPPGFVTLRFASGQAHVLVVGEESLPALTRLFEWQLWHSTAAPLTMLEVSDSAGNRWYWQTHG
jgi:hypothetical protein